MSSLSLRRHWSVLVFGAVFSQHPYQVIMFTGFQRTHKYLKMRKASGLAAGIYQFSAHCGWLVGWLVLMFRTDVCADFGFDACATWNSIPNVVRLCCPVCLHTCGFVVNSVITVPSPTRRNVLVWVVWHSATQYPDDNINPMLPLREQTSYMSHMNTTINWRVFVIAALRQI